MLLRSRWIRLALAIASGFILVFAYPRWNIEAAVWLWMFPLLLVLWSILGDIDPSPAGPVSKPARKLRPFLTGYLTGLAFFVPNLFWIRNSSRVLAGALDNSWVGLPAELMGFGAVTGLCGIISCYVGLWTWFYVRIIRPSRRLILGGTWWTSSIESLRVAFLAAAMWAGCEWLRGIVFTGFGWNGLGIGLHRNLILIQAADLIGATGLSFLPVFVAVVAFHTALRILHDYREGRRMRARLDFTVAMALVLATAGYGWRKLSQPVGETIPVRTVLIQLNIPQAEKWAHERDPEVYQRLADLTRLYATAREGQTGVDLVVWPESAIPLPLFGHPDHPAYFNEIAQFGDFSLLTGVDVDEPNGPSYTSAMLLRGSFDNRQYYHKVHLVPFGEYLPFREIGIVNRLLGGVLPGDFDPGPSTEPLPLEKPKVGIIPLICFEDTLGRLARQFVRPGPQMIVNMTNDGWFLHSPQTEQHLANALFRAIELRRPMCRAANTGVTCFIDTFGRVTDRLQDPTTGDTFIEGCLPKEMKLPVHPGLTLYARWGEWFSVAMLLLCAAVLVGNLLRRMVTRTRQKTLAAPDSAA